MKDARAFGFPEDVIANLKAQLAGGDAAEQEDGIWPDNLPIVEAFLAVGSQWRTAAIGGGLAPARLLYLGLDYTAARIGLAAAGIRVTPGLWAGLRVMEAAACAALNDADR